MEDPNNAACTHHCQDCGLSYVTAWELSEHRWTIIHHINLDKQGQTSHACELCGVRAETLAQFSQHVNGKRHHRTLSHWRTTYLKQPKNKNKKTNKEKLIKSVTKKRSVENCSDEESDVTVTSQCVVESDTSSSENSGQEETKMPPPKRDWEQDRGYRSKKGWGRQPDWDGPQGYGGRIPQLMGAMGGRSILGPGPRGAWTGYDPSPYFMNYQGRMGPYNPRPWDYPPGAANDDFGGFGSQWHGPPFGGAADFYSDFSNRMHGSRSFDYDHSSVGRFDDDSIQEGGESRFGSTDKSKGKDAPKGKESKKKKVPTATLR